VREQVGEGGREWERGELVQRAALYEQPIREAATRVPGLQLEPLKASTASEIDAAFETLVQQKASAVIVGSDPFFSSRATQLIVLAARNNLPVVYANREVAIAGALITSPN